MSMEKMNAPRTAWRVVSLSIVVLTTLTALLFLFRNVSVAAPQSRLERGIAADPIFVVPPLRMLEEDFDADIFPPVGWQLFRNSLGVGGWFQADAYAQSVDYSIGHLDNQRDQDSWIVLPLVTPTVGARLVFAQYQRFSSHYGKHSVWVSTGDSHPKEGDYKLVAEVPLGPKNQWSDVAVPITGYSQQGVYIAIRYEGSFADQWYIDDVIVSGELGATNNSPVALGATSHLSASVMGDNVSYVWDLGDGNSSSDQYPAHVYGAPGMYTALVTSTDGLGAVYTATTAVVVQAAIEGLAAVSDAPTVPGDVTTLSATLTAGDGVSYLWDFGDGSPMKQGQVVTHTYAHGIFTATVSAENLVSSATATATVLVEQPIEGLMLSHNAPTVLGKPTVYSITITSGSNVNYEWDFGEGTPTRGQWQPDARAHWTRAGLAMQTFVLSHTYSTFGTYEPTFTISNLAGSHVVSDVIDVDVPIGGPLAEEQFEDGRLPDNWYRMTVHQESPGWVITDSVAYEGQMSAMHDDTFGPQDAWLVMDVVTPTKVSTLRFWQRVKYTHVYSNHSVWISTGNPDPKFEEFTLFQPISPTVEQTWEMVEYDLSAYEDEPIYIAFRYQGDYASEWAIDDIVVTDKVYATNDSITRWGEASTMTGTVRNGSRIEWTWAFSDTNTGAGQTTSHTYLEPGDYQALVTATNSLGFMTATTTVSVRAMVFVPIVSVPPPLTTTLTTTVRFGR